MEFLELKDISEQYMELINPISAEKVLAAGKALGLQPGHRVIDFGCGFGEALALWGRHYGISGVGIDIRPYAAERARQKMAALNLPIEIICGSAADYPFEPHTFDAAVCLGATFIWDGFGPTAHHLKTALRPGGKAAIGEVYWRTAHVPPEYARRQQTIPTEAELLPLIRQEGYHLETVIRASQDDWDRYESGNWVGLLRWLEANPNHPDRPQVQQFLHTTQDEYFRYGREFFGWAIYLLCPTSS
jgi:SAM-dependent methyltransferase